MPGPFHSSITSTFFVSLINRLGIRPPPPDGFDLINTVQPVSIVDSDIVIPASITPQLMDIPFTAGDVVGAGAGAILADTGALAAGNYQVLIQYGTDNSGAITTSLLFQRRDAANAANRWELRATCNSGAAVSPFSWMCQPFFVTLADNERIRVVNQIAAALLTQKANIWITKLL